MKGGNYVCNHSNQNMAEGAPSCGKIPLARNVREQDTSRIRKTRSVELLLETSFLDWLAEKDREIKQQRKEIKERMEKEKAQAELSEVRFD